MADQQTAGMKLEDVLKLIATMNEQQQKNFMEFAKELRKPTEAEQKKMDEESAKLRAKIEQRVKLARIEEESREMRKRTCPHTRPDGVHTWVAQVHADGYFRPTCIICQTQLPKIKATTEQLVQGVELNRYQTLDIPSLERWAKMTETAVVA